MSSTRVVFFFSVLSSPRSFFLSSPIIRPRQTSFFFFLPHCQKYNLFRKIKKKRGRIQHKLLALQMEIAESVLDAVARLINCFIVGLFFYSTLAGSSDPGELANQEVHSRTYLAIIREINIHWNKPPLIVVPSAMQMSGLMSRASDSVIPFINVSAPFFPCFSVLHYSVLIRSHSLFLTLSCSLNPKSAKADKNTNRFLLSISSFFFSNRDLINLSRPRRSPWRQRERKADPAGVPGHLKKVDDGQTFHTTPPAPRPPRAGSVRPPSQQVTLPPSLCCAARVDPLHRSVGWRTIIRCLCATSCDLGGGALND